jgi:predicted DCC family thiol-disulfide oxidoreductase YuxK
LQNIELLKDKSIVLFDGSCGLCNKSVKFVLKKEKNYPVGSTVQREPNLFFAPLQSQTGTALLKQYGLEHKIDSIVFVKGGKAYIKSSAALQVTKYLKGLWPLLFGFYIIPKFIRDAVYDFIAKNRITWFGNADYCEMLTPELKKRFLE